MIEIVFIIFLTKIEIAGQPSRGIENDPP